jgi:phosphatidylglycerophosphate synthase
MADAAAALLIAPGAAVPAGTVLLGLTLPRRLALAGRRAGFDVVREPGEPLEAGPGAARVRLVVVPADVVPQASFLKSLRALPLAPERLHRAGAALLVETSDAAGAAETAGAGAAALEARFGPAIEVLEPRGAFTLRSSSDLPAAERWLLRSLIKDEEGFMSRHVERKISLAVTRLLVGTGITPNAMTIVSVLVGLAGAPFFFTERPASQVTGALLFLAHSILDGCDGELARLKYLESRWGGILDFWGDNVVHVAIFLAISAGWARTLGAPWPLLLGASAALGTIFSALFVYRTTMAPKTSATTPLFTSVVAAPQRSRISVAADALARRDFIYLVVILSAFGKARWFLVLAALGSPAFFLVLLALSRGGKRLERRLA